MSQNAGNTTFWGLVLLARYRYAQPRQTAFLRHMIKRCRRPVGLGPLGHRGLQVRTTRDKRFLVTCTT